MPGLGLVVGQGLLFTPLSLSFYTSKQKCFGPIDLIYVQKLNSAKVLNLLPVSVQRAFLQSSIIDFYLSASSLDNSSLYITVVLYVVLLHNSKVKL